MTRWSSFAAASDGLLAITQSLPTLPAGAPDIAVRFSAACVQTMAAGALVLPNHEAVVLTAQILYHRRKMLVAGGAPHLTRSVRPEDIFRCTCGGLVFREGHRPEMYDLDGALHRSTCTTPPARPSTARELEN